MERALRGGRSERGAVILNGTLNDCRREGSLATCGYCREGVEAALACPGCAALYHPDCAGALGRCGTIGCRRELLGAARGSAVRGAGAHRARRGERRVPVTGEPRTWLQGALVLLLLALPWLGLEEPERQTGARQRAAYEEEARVMAQVERHVEVERARRVHGLVADLHIVLWRLGGRSDGALHSRAERLARDLVEALGGDVPAARRSVLQYRNEGCSRFGCGDEVRRSVEVVLPLEAESEERPR